MSECRPRKVGRKKAVLQPGSRGYSTTHPSVIWGHTLSKLLSNGSYTFTKGRLLCSSQKGGTGGYVIVIFFFFLNLAKSYLNINLC